MKNIKYVRYGFMLLMCVLLLACGDKNKKIDRSLLPGKWQQGTLFEVYNVDGTGHTWDEADDVTEEEAQEMTWTLDENELTQLHKMEIGTGVIPKVYTVTELTATTFKYKDNYKSCSFTRVK
ncbi:MAG: hypothetical protein LBH82_07230 [Bacteroidales bacterium]|jgi:hypothetical protein|nr:hypothetical protein [Bacteroidales bacterium]